MELFFTRPPELTMQTRDVPDQALFSRFSAPPLPSHVPTPSRSHTPTAGRCPLTDAALMCSLLAATVPSYGHTITVP